MNSRSLLVFTGHCICFHHLKSGIRGAVIMLLTASLYLSGSARADTHDAEVGGFRLTDISGSTAIRYLLTDRDRASQGVEGSFETQQNLEADLFILTRSYLYHPDFLDMVIGGGPLLVFQNFSATAGTNSSDEAFFNFVADLKFLEQKAYPVRAYYELSHPSVSTSLLDRWMEQIKERSAFKEWGLVPVGNSPEEWNANEKQLG